MSIICIDTCLEMLSPLVSCSVDNVLWKIDHTAIPSVHQQLLMLVKDSEGKKIKCWYPRTYLRVV